MYKIKFTHDFHMRQTEEKEVFKVDFTFFQTSPICIFFFRFSTILSPFRVKFSRSLYNELSRMPVKLIESAQKITVAILSRNSTSSR